MSLLSGRTELVETKLDVDIETFKQHAQSALKVGRGRILDARGSVLEGSRTRSIRDCGLQTGDVLTLQLQPVAILALPLDDDDDDDRPLCTFVARLGDGSVVTWGHGASSGDSSAVRDQLRNVQQIQASNGACAAILGDGSVVTWGHEDDGGDSSAVQDELQNVQQIQANRCAFAAILGDGSVVT